MLNYSKQTSLYAKVWQNAGLDFLFIEEEARREELKKSKKNQIIQTSRPVQQNTFTKSSFENKISQKENILQNSLQSSPRTSEEAREQHELYEHNYENSSFSKYILKEYEWSKYWLALYEKVVKCKNPKVAWTYSGLYADILKEGKQNPERQNLIRRLIQALARGQGTHTFIPYDIEQDKDLILKNSNSNFYWSVINKLQVRHLFIFGEKARDELFLPERRINSSFIYQGYKVYLLPELTQVMQTQGQEESLLRYLNTQLSYVNI